MPRYAGTNAPCNRVQPCTLQTFATCAAPPCIDKADISALKSDCNCHLAVDNKCAVQYTCSHMDQSLYSICWMKSKLSLPGMLIRVQSLHADPWGTTLPWE